MNYQQNEVRAGPHSLGEMLKPRTEQFGNDGHCFRCGHALSRYNPNNVCEACKITLRRIAFASTKPMPSGKYTDMKLIDLTKRKPIDLGPAATNPVLDQIQQDKNGS